jgi:hypothetical protein
VDLQIRTVESDNHYPVGLHFIVEYNGRIFEARSVAGQAAGSADALRQL